MRSRKLAGILRAIRRRFPGTRVLLEPGRSPDGDPHIRWWLHVLDVPARWRYRAWRFALRKGHETYGPGRVPYFTDVHGPRESAAAIATCEEGERRYREWRRARVAAGRKRRLRERTLRAGRAETTSAGRRHPNRRG